MRDPNNLCLFCIIDESGCAHEHNLAYASYDTYPVSKYHCLIIPKRHIKDFFELTDEELVACNDLIRKVKDEVIKKDPNIDGFNLGTNIGRVSGQSILHCHFHLIPRRLGDVENPQGGVRSVIPNKQHWDCIHIQPNFFSKPFINSCHKKISICCFNRHQNPLPTKKPFKNQNSSECRIFIEKFLKFHPITSYFTSQLH